MSQLGCQAECPICFNEFDEGEYSPIRLFCRCKQTLCKECLQSMVKTSSFCPWDRTRWTGRNLIQKCIQETPEDYLSQILKNIGDEIESAVVRGPTSTGGSDDTEHSAKPSSTKTDSSSSKASLKSFLAQQPKIGINEFMNKRSILERKRKFEDVTKVGNSIANYFQKYDTDVELIRENIKVGWSCSLCTFYNQSNSCINCEVCGSKRVRYKSADS